MSELTHKITQHLATKKAIWISMNDGNVHHINKYNFIGVISDAHGEWIEINDGKTTSETIMYNLVNCKSIKFG